MILRRLLVLAAVALLLRSFPGAAQTTAPIWVYNNWSAYDELSDNVPLTEELAMRELDEVLRFRKLGVRFDYYMMDAFWYDPEGGYRTWKPEAWPNGPDRWIEACKANGIEPGLWFSTNSLTQMKPIPLWMDSLDKHGHAMALYKGGFLPDFMDVLRYWYERGIRMFKFDFAELYATAKGDDTALSPREIRMKNAWALYEALLAFRQENPDVVLVGFNGIVGDVSSVKRPVTSFATNWLAVFDSLYSGDPRPADVPAMDFWRAMDIYADHMVRAFEANGIPLERVDSTSFMLGETGTNYRRGTSAWRSSLVLMLAHGGWINTVHGSLELLSDDDVRWFAKVQSMYEPLQIAGSTRSFGGPPGDTQPYGFASVGRNGALYAVVNPSQRARVVKLPPYAEAQPAVTPRGGRILFRDSGFDPVIQDDSLWLGPGQVALVGFGRYARTAYDLGVEPDIRIPLAIERIDAKFAAVKGSEGPAVKPRPGLPALPRVPLAIETVIDPPDGGDLRIVLRRRDAQGALTRRYAQSTMGRHLLINAFQGDRRLPLDIRYDKVVWSGLSWAVGEIRHGDISLGEPIRIQLSTAEREPGLKLEGRVYRVDY